ncbi:transmembrane 220 family protein [Negadavirga shengliensis]|uniref:Transmembrane 220 family protein n=1 Tax=Negadavirga shengliensis TaxID=1389218 RepID=A0ABV9T5T8_9BACT
MNKSWKVFFGVWALLFLLFAYLQLNDPDPEWWVPAYLLAATMSGLGAFGFFPIRILVVLTFGYLIVAMFFWPENIGGWISQEWAQKDLTMKTEQMEINREFFGLVIMAVVSALAAIVGRQQYLAGKKDLN